MAGWISPAAGTSAATRRPPPGRTGRSAAPRRRGRSGPAWRPAGAPCRPRWRRSPWRWRAGRVRAAGTGPARRGPSPPGRCRCRRGRSRGRRAGSTAACWTKRDTVALPWVGIDVGVGVVAHGREHASLARGPARRARSPAPGARPCRSCRATRRSAARRHGAVSTPSSGPAGSKTGPTYVTLSGSELGTWSIVAGTVTITRSTRSSRSPRRVTGARPRSSRSSLMSLVEARHRHRPDRAVVQQGAVERVDEGHRAPAGRLGRAQRGRAACSRRRRRTDRPSPSASVTSSTISLGVPLVGRRARQ